MEPHPLVFDSAYSITGVNVGTTATTAGALWMSSFLLIYVLVNSAKKYRFVLFAVLALTALLVANNARADYQATVEYFTTSEGGVVGASGQAVCSALSAGSQITYQSGWQGDGCYVTSTLSNQYPTLYAAVAVRYICPYGGAITGITQCTGNPSCPSGQFFNGTSCAVLECQNGTIVNGACSCGDSGIYFSDTGNCSPCPSSGQFGNNGSAEVGGDGDIPETVCLGKEGNVGCAWRLSSGIGTGGSWSGRVGSPTGKNCTTDEPATPVDEPTPDNPDDPQDCLRAGLGFISSGGNTQCVQNGTAGEPIKKVATKEGVATDGTKSVTTTVTNNYGGSTTSTTTTTISGGGSPTPQTTTSTEGSTAGDLANTKGGQCGAPGQPPCAVTGGGPTAGDMEAAAADLPGWGDTFNGSESTALLGNPKATFLADVRSNLEQLVMLPELPTGGTATLQLWDGLELNIEPAAQHLRSILEWLFYVTLVIHGFFEVRRFVEAS